MPITTKPKSGAMGVELRKTKSNGTPIATHTGQNLFTGDFCAASTIYLKAKEHEAAATPSALYHKADAFPGTVVETAITLIKLANQLNLGAIRIAEIPPLPESHKHNLDLCTPL